MSGGLCIAIGVAGGLVAFGLAMRAPRRDSLWGYAWMAGVVAWTDGWCIAAVSV